VDALSHPPGLDKIGPESHLGEFAIVRVTVQDIQQEQETGTLVQSGFYTAVLLRST